MRPQRKFSKPLDAVASQVPGVGKISDEVTLDTSMVSAPPPALHATPKESLGVAAPSLLGCLEVHARLLAASGQFQQHGRLTDIIVNVGAVKTLVTQANGYFFGELAELVDKLAEIL